MGKLHSDDFKRDTVRMALTSGLTWRQLSKDLGIGFLTLNRWVRKHGHEVEGAPAPIQDGDVLDAATLAHIKEHHRLCLGTYARARMTQELKEAGIIPAATENDSCIRWYKGRDCGPRSEQGIAAKAAPVVNEGPVGGETRSVSAVRHKCLYSRDCGPHKRTPSPKGAGNVRGEKNVSRA